MRICFVADARSPIAINWISYFIARRHDVNVISTYPCDQSLLNGAQVYQLPIAFSKFSRPGHNGKVQRQAGRRAFDRVLASLRGGLSPRTALARFWVASFDVERHVLQAGEIIGDISPDIVHAMRIPFEGVLAAKATPAGTPLVVSVWGNDFTLFANRYPHIASQTEQALLRADALHCDCNRDLTLARGFWRFSQHKPAAVLPGAGGVQLDVFQPNGARGALRDKLRIGDNAPVVFNPRGFRAYVRNDMFIASIPEVLSRFPEAIFLCSGLKGNSRAERQVTRIGISENVRLLPVLPREEMAAFFCAADISVSPSLHDGTPNTLLEAMACGAFPVAGDIDSVREWIDDGINGLLCNATDPKSIAGAIIKALRDSEMRQRAARHTLELICARADYVQVMQQAEQFYLRVLERQQTAAVV